MMNQKHSAPITNSCFTTHTDNNKPISLALAALISLFIFPSNGWSVEKGTTIIGSDESPTILNIVPWKSEELDEATPLESSAAPSSSILDQVLKPLDRDELQREVQYFNLLHPEEEKVDIKQKR